MPGWLIALLPTIVIILAFVLFALLKTASDEDEELEKLLEKHLEEKSIENANVFIQDVGEEKDDEEEAIIEGKTLNHYIVVNKEIRDAFLKNKNFNPDPNDVKILGVDLNEEYKKELPKNEKRL